MNGKRVVALLVILVLTFSLIGWLRDGDWHIARALPLLGGNEPSWLYDAFGGAGMLVIVLWGLRRLVKHTK